MKANLISERLLLTLWIGSLWAISYIAVPTAFVTLGDVTLAGNYAGKLFSTVNILGLGCGIVLLIAKVITYGKQVTGLWRFWVLVLMLVLTLIFSCYLQPEIVKIKQFVSHGNDAMIEHFDFLHSLSRNLYAVLSLLGLALIVSTDKAES
jgi:hypothetical protein